MLQFVANSNFGVILAGASMSYLPVVTAVVPGLIELGVGWTLIQHSEFFGRIFSKGMDERF
jgi:hypothetical protein